MEHLGHGGGSACSAALSDSSPCCWCSTGAFLGGASAHGPRDAGAACAQVQGLQENCKDLRQHTAASEAQRAGLEAEAGEMDARWHAAMAETARLRTELQRLRSMFQARPRRAAPGGPRSARERRQQARARALRRACRCLTNHVRSVYAVCRCG
jgi:hypothetical protein